MPAPDTGSPSAARRRLQRFGLALPLLASATLADPAPDHLEPLVWESQGTVVWARTSDGYRATGMAPEPGYLVSSTAYGPLRLTLEVWLAPETNSGVFVGCAPGAPISPFSCYEANLWDHHPNRQARTGALVGISPPLQHVETLGRWNRLEIQAGDDQLRVWINDTLTADIRPERPVHGHLALQFGGAGEVYFRRIQIAPWREPPQDEPSTQAGTTRPITPLD